MDEKIMDEILRSSLAPDREPEDALNQAIISRVQKRRRSRRRHSVEMAAGIALMFIVAGSFLFHEQIRAVMQQFFGSITEYYGEDKTREQKKETEEEVSKVGDTVVSRNIPITLEEVLVDANKVVYSARVKIQDKSVHLGDELDMKAHVFINGQELEKPAVASPVEVSEDSMICVGETPLNPGMEFSGEVHVEIVISSLGFKQIIDGEWKFDATVNVDKANSHTIKDMTSHKIEMSDGSILYIEKVIRTSTDCKLYGKIVWDQVSYWHWGKSITLKIAGKDNLGNEISFEKMPLHLEKEGKTTVHLVLNCEQTISQGAEYLMLRPTMQRGKEGDVETGKEFRVKVGKE